jgi:phage shock protein E
MKSFKLFKTILGFTGFFLFLASSCAPTKSNGVVRTNFTSINSEKLVELRKDTSIQIIDVRTPGEISDGFIPGTTLFFDINSDDFDAKIDKLDKSKKYIVYCKSGGRSSRAVETMRGKGFKYIYELEGGISSWSGELKK